MARRDTMAYPIEKMIEGESSLRASTSQSGILAPVSKKRWKCIGQHLYYNISIG